MWAKPLKNIFVTLPVHLAGNKASFSVGKIILGAMPSELVMLLLVVYEETPGFTDLCEEKAGFDSI